MQDLKLKTTKLSQSGGENRNLIYLTPVQIQILKEASPFVLTFGRFEKFVDTNTID